MIVKMIQDIGTRMEAKIEKIQEMFTKDLEELKNKPTEMNNTLERLNSRITEAEEQVNELDDRTVEITAAEQNTEKRMKRNEDSLRDLRDNIKHTNTQYTNICITGVPEGEDFPGGSDSKASAYNAADPGSIPGSGKSPGEGNGNPL